jgi:hypothetical protein
MSRRPAVSIVAGPTSTKASGAIDEIAGVATCTKFRRFNVSTDEVLRKPPPG